jgi:predicted Rossmann fold nucleotide-binding protein DprA/Smf involved in DNA uptake
MFPPQCIDHTDPGYPLALRLYLKGRAPAALIARGHPHLLNPECPSPRVALFCSVQTPDAVIARTYEVARALAHSGVTVISGFHSPMEKECLRTLLLGTAPVIYCPARGIGRLRLRAEWKIALEDRRLLLLSPFEDKEQRPTTGRAKIRNQVVAALADAVFVAHAAPGGKLERFCHDTCAWGKPLFTPAGDENANLLALGAKGLTPDQISGEVLAALLANEVKSTVP